MVKNFACGAGKRIGHGIEQFTREHGCKPAALILHPAHADAFAREPELDSGLLNGVSVIVSPLFDVPALVGQQGSQHEL